MIPNPLSSDWFSEKGLNAWISDFVALKAMPSLTYTGQSIVYILFAFDMVLPL